MADHEPQPPSSKFWRGVATTVGGIFRFGLEPTGNAVEEYRKRIGHSSVAACGLLAFAAVVTAVAWVAVSSMHVYVYSDSINRERDARANTSEIANEAAGGRSLTYRSKPSMKAEAAVGVTITFHRAHNTDEVRGNWSTRVTVTKPDDSVENTPFGTAWGPEDTSGTTEGSIHTTILPPSLFAPHWTTGTRLNIFVELVDSTTGRTVTVGSDNVVVP
jgi:hypothetical protein